MRIFGSSILALCCAFLPPFAGSADDVPDSYTQDDLTRLKTERDAARAQLDALESAADLVETDLNKLNRQLLAAAQESRRREEEAITIERRLIDLHIRADTIERQLLSDEEGLEELIAALMAVSSRKPPSLVTSPDNAGEAIRAAMLMGAIAPELRARADRLADELDEMDRLRRRIEGEQLALDAAEAVLAEKSLEIERLAAAKRRQFTDVSGETDALKARLQTLSRDVDTLSQLLENLEAVAPPAPARKPAAPGARETEPAEMTMVALERRDITPSNLSGLIRPATGRTALRFGEKSRVGTKSDGLVIATRGGAQVVAPADARIEYAGDFRTYGQMVILQTSDGYHIVLSGLGELYGSPGQMVLSGEPVGRMAEQTSPAPHLYMELRKGDTLLDPAPLMKRGDG